MTEKNRGAFARNRFCFWIDAVFSGLLRTGSTGANSWESSDIDAIASASITLMDGEAKGNVEAMAQMIGSLTGGDLFSIRTVQKYPVNYDELINVGGEERRANAHPELAAHVENMESYDIIFLGYPTGGPPFPCPSLLFWKSMISPAKRFCHSAVMAEEGLAKARLPLQSWFRTPIWRRALRSITQAALVCRMM